MTTLLAAVQSAGSGSLPNVLYASSFLSDKTGASNSHDKFMTAIGACAGTSVLNIVEIIVDCPMRVTIGTDDTQTLFLPSNTKITCSPSGYIITDPVMLHLFEIMHATDVTFKDLAMEYVGAFGVIAIDQQNPASAAHGTISNYNDVSGKAYMASGKDFAANTFIQGGSYLFPSATNACALVNICGQADRIRFEGTTKLWASQTAGASSFIPYAINMFPQWAPGLTISSAVQTSPPTSTTPTPVQINNGSADIQCINNFLTGYVFNFATSVGSGSNGVVAGTNYYVLSSTGTSFRVSTSATGSAIVFNASAATSVSGFAVGVGHVYVEDIYIDGYYMGICGSCKYLEIGKIRGVRYSDIQDANGNNLGGQVFAASTLSAAPVANNSFITLQTAWQYDNASYTVTLSTGVQCTGNFVLNSQNVNLYILGSSPQVPYTIPSGTYSNVAQVTYSQNWFAPPHLMYLHQLDTNNSFPMTFNVRNYMDEGAYRGSVNRRSVGSGYINSCKLEPANGSVFDGAVSLRPDGMMDILAFNGSNGVIRNCYCQLYTATTQTGTLTFTGAVNNATSATLTAPWPFVNSSLQATFNDGSLYGTARTVTLIQGQTSCTWSGAVTATNTAGLLNTAQTVANFAFRFPNSPPIKDLILEIDWVDLSPVATGFPCLGDGQPGNTGITIKSRGTVQDWPYGATYYPGFSMGGTNINIESTLTWINCTSMQTYHGSGEETGSTLMTESNYKLTLVGWRTTQLLFAGSSVSTSSTAQTLASGFLQPTGTYTIAFSTGEQRQVAFTQGSTACTLSSALTQTATNVSSLQYMNGSNLDSYKNLIQLMQNGFAYGNTFEVNDATNTYYGIVRDGLQKELYTQLWQGSPIGAYYDTGMIFPNTFSVTAHGSRVVTTLTGTGGVSTYSIGCAANATLLDSGISLSAGNPFNPAYSPIPLPTASTNIRVTPNTGTITAGTMYLSVEGQRSCMAS